MKKRISFVLLLMSCSLCLCFMSSTYSRYVAGTTGNIDILFAKWQILINTQDITNQNNSNISITPTIEQNENIRENTVAPTSKGYFDIDIDPTNVDVSFTYSIELEINNEEIPDLMITKYAILPNDYEEGDTIEYTTLQTNTITNNLLYDNETENFNFEPFTIRIYFEWYEGEEEQMNDEADTAIGSTPTEENEELSFTINANISFEQIIESEIEPNETP